ncbi:MAG: amidohydrolase [Candidatus Eisenbacteria bacterium]|mgnify:FL=1
MRPRADLLIVDARPWSDGAALPEADAIAVADGRVLAVGRAADLSPLAGPQTRRLDAGGGTVTPALVDAHIHLVAWARSRGALELFDCRSRAEALARVAGFLADHPATATVVGRGWDANLWSEVPDRAALDAVTGARPVLLHSKDFHSLWVNSVALARAGVTRDTPDPPGGRLERDGAGEPNGVAREHAVRLFTALAPPEGLAADLARVRDAVRALHAEGITAVHDFEGADEHRVLRALTRGDGPCVRVLMHLAHAGLDHALALGLASGTGGDRFRVGALKLFADGTLGSQTAALLEAYEGSADRGLELIPPAELTALVARATAGSLAVAIHAIGDRAVRSSLDAIAAAGPAARASALPPRIEHVQLLDPADLPRFAALGVVASMQPSHCTSDIDNAHRHWGRRVDRSYPWRSLLGSGARLAFGSDAPVEAPATAHGLHSAVTRQRTDGTPVAGFVPAERLDLDAALTAYTEGPARASGAWPRLGRIAPGAIADLALWSTDLHRAAPPELSGVQVTATVMEGEVVFERTGRTPTPASVGRPAAEPAAARGGAR